ncbi:MAG: hypothetical protein ABW019_14715 [Chitinophagaceae bacterium]
MKNILPAFFLLLFFQLAHAQQFTLSDHMSAREIGQAMQAYPPSIDHVDARMLIAQSLDKLIHFSVKQDITDEQVAELAPIRDLYLRQVDHNLDALEQSKVAEGVRIFKFYSSSVIIQSKEGVIAVDFQQGPHLTYCGNPDKPDPVAVRTGFHWSPQQLDRLARLVDVSLITHAHADHADYELSRRLAALKKTTIVTQQLKELWKNLGESLVVPDYGTAQQFGPVSIYTMLGHQYMENDKATKDSAGNVYGHPSTDPSITDAETVVYLARIGGLVFLQAGENNDPADEWLQKGMALGFTPDIKMSVGARQGARSVNAALAGKPIFFLPVHEYEMGHGGGGNRTAVYYADNRGNLIRKGGCMPLFWGENYAINDSMLRK